MNKASKGLILLVTVLIFGGASVGAYYGLKDTIADNAASKVPAALFTMFGSDATASPLSGFASPLIEYGARVNNGEAYFYQVHSTDGNFGSFRFALGVEDGAISDYLFLEDINAQALGLGQYSKADSDIFDGYTLDDPIPNPFTGLTISYNCVKDAIEAVLTDVQERSN